MNSFSTALPDTGFELLDDTVDRHEAIEEDAKLISLGDQLRSRLGTQEFQEMEQGAMLSAWPRDGEARGRRIGRD